MEVVDDVAEGPAAMAVGAMAVVVTGVVATMVGWATMGARAQMVAVRMAVARFGKVGVVRAAVGSLDFLCRRSKQCRTPRSPNLRSMREYVRTHCTRRRPCPPREYHPGKCRLSSSPG